MRRLTLLGLVLSVGCNVVDEEDLAEALARIDSGVVDVDTGTDTGTDTGAEDTGTPDTGPEDAGQPDAGPPAGDTCGDPDAMLLTGRQSIVVDTRPHTNTENGFSLRPCDQLGGMPGNEIFYRLEVQDGEYWHFHLAVDASAGIARDPKIFVLPADGSGGCNEAACEVTYFSNACSGSGDEHFGFEFPRGGEWFLGIDDGLEGGGVYDLEAFRPTCGDGMRVHGEPCDHMEEGTRPCSQQCRGMIGDTGGVAAFGFPINAKEANEVTFNGSFDPVNIMNVALGGGGENACNYPYFFALNISDVDAPATIRATGSRPGCPGAAGSPLMGLELFVNRGTTLELQAAGSGTCPTVEATDLAAGLYYVVARDLRTDKGEVLAASVNFQLTPAP